jgi:hypothetical protein
MKFIFFSATLVFVSLQFISCKKNNSIIQDSQKGIVGKWQIKTDSSFAGVGANNHEEVYDGMPGDYFDIRTDSNIYLKESLLLDTLSYHIISDSTMIISTFGIIFNGVPTTCQIINLTAHTVTIKAPVALTPGGAFGRTISLTR